MTKLRSSLRNNLLLALLMWPATLHAVAASGGDYTMTKTLVGGSGVAQVTSAEYSAAYCLTEDIAGWESHGGGYSLVSGYFSGYASGYSGTFNLLGATIGTTRIMQDGFQMGVPLDAPIYLNFSSPLDPNTIESGVELTMIMDHMGQSRADVQPWTYTYDVTGTTVVITPQGSWLGNTLYDIAGTLSLRNIDGFGLAPSPHPQFITMLDPHKQNVVLHPIPTPDNPSASSSVNGAGVTLTIPQEALSDYAYVLVSQDPAHAPLRIDPAILQTANAKALHSGGAYQTPLAFEEIVAYNKAGTPVSLSKASNITVTYNASQGFVTGTALPIRASSLSLWYLDSAHALWVKMPDSQASDGGVLGPVSQFSVYALMGSAAMNATDVFVFPVPWRPNGPNAGIGPGQTGTESGGITFSNLPSECTIKIYTLSGEKVRELRHSDLSGSVGQEKWDGNTPSGDHAASGVYLWRVESATDSKNGKLMIIR